MRRYAPLKPSKGTVIPQAVRQAVLARDQGCVGRRLDWPGDCLGALELDHVRASHGMGMKSETSAGNLVALCGVHHRLRTEYGRIFRPRLIDYLIASDSGHDAHVDPCGPDCRAAVAR
jgi:5-methylcytosine-specific restriction endonuclease McrA